MYVPFSDEWRTRKFPFIPDPFTRWLLSAEMSPQKRSTVFSDFKSKLGRRIRNSRIILYYKSVNAVKFQFFSIPIVWTSVKIDGERRVGGIEVLAQTDAVTSAHSRTEH